MSKPWQITPVGWMLINGITTGTSPTTFSPDDFVTRGQLAAFFYRFKGSPPVVIDLSSPLCGPPPPPTTFGAGTHLVGTDIPAGTYRAHPSSGCFWERLSGLGGTFDEIIANEFYSGDWRSALVTVSPTDVAFAPDSDCGTWTSDLSPVTASTTAQFGAGQHIVGVDIGAGTWRATGGDGCYWERRSGHSGSFADIIANDFTDAPPTVAIAATDVGFHTDTDCGTWTKIG